MNENEIIEILFEEIYAYTSKATPEYEKMIEKLESELKSYDTYSIITDAVLAEAYEAFKAGFQAAKALLK